MPDVEPQRITLPDGRGLAYAEYGAPQGRPVMLFPGTPGSHVLASVAATPALARGVRVIAPDRPGIGRSDPLPDRTVGDWPADAAVLADALGLERFAVIGVSGGGPYALACAARLGARVDAVGVVSGAGQYDLPGALDGMPPHLRLTWMFIRGAPGPADAVLRAGGACVARFPDQALSVLSRMGPDADAAVQRRDDFRALFRRDVAETFRQGPGGAARDLVLYARPWEFAPREVAQHVHLWHGAADGVIPAGQARRLAEALPSCTPYFVPAAGHFWFVDHMDVVLDAVFGA